MGIIDTSAGQLLRLLLLNRLPHFSNRGNHHSRLLDLHVMAAAVGDQPAPPPRGRRDRGWTPRLRTTSLAGPAGSTVEGKLRPRVLGRPAVTAKRWVTSGIAICCYDTYGIDPPGRRGGHEPHPCVTGGPG